MDGVESASVVSTTLDRFAQLLGLVISMVSTGVSEGSGSPWTCFTAFSCESCVQPFAGSVLSGRPNINLLVGGVCEHETRGADERRGGPVLFPLCYQFCLSERERESFLRRKLS